MRKRNLIFVLAIAVAGITAAGVAAVRGKHAGPGPAATAPLP